MSTTHRIDRALERYNITLTWDDLKAMDGLISDHNRLASKPGATIHAIVYRGKTFIVTVTALRQGGRGIVTFLPPDHFDHTQRVQSLALVTGKRGKPLGHRRERVLRDRRAGRIEA